MCNYVKIWILCLIKKTKLSLHIYSSGVVHLLRLSSFPNYYSWLWKWLNIGNFYPSFFPGLDPWQYLLKGLLHPHLNIWQMQVCRFNMYDERPQDQQLSCCILTRAFWMLLSRKHVLCSIRTMHLLCQILKLELQTGQ